MNAAKWQPFAPFFALTFWWKWSTHGVIWCWWCWCHFYIFERKTFPFTKKTLSTCGAVSINIVVSTHWFRLKGVFFPRKINIYYVREKQSYLFAFWCKRQWYTKVPTDSDINLIYYCLSIRLMRTYCDSHLLNNASDSMNNLFRYGATTASIIHLIYSNANRNIITEFPNFHKFIKR